MKKNRRYNVIFIPEEEGGYMASVPSLPGCVSYGATIEEAKEMIRDAITGYVASLEKHNEPIPNDGEFLLSLVEVPEVVYA